jgi:hypothetical protein
MTKKLSIRLISSRNLVVKASKLQRTSDEDSKAVKASDEDSKLLFEI